VSRKCRFLNNLTGNHIVTITADSKGITEPPVSMASIRLKVLRFEVDATIALFLGNSPDLGHCEVRSRFAVTGNTRHSLRQILPKRHRECQGKWADLTLAPTVDRLRDASNSKTQRAANLRAPHLCLGPPGVFTHCRHNLDTFTGIAGVVEIKHR